MVRRRGQIVKEKDVGQVKVIAPARKKAGEDRGPKQADTENAETEPRKGDQTRSRENNRRKPRLKIERKKSYGTITAVQRDN